MSRRPSSSNSAKPATSPPSSTTRIRRPAMRARRSANGIGGDAGRGRRELGGRRLLVVGGALRRHLVSNNPCTKAAHVLNLRELTGSSERAAEAVTKVGG